MNAADEGHSLSTPSVEDATSASDVALVERERDFFSHTSAIITLTEDILQYAKITASYQSALPDLHKMQSAAEQLAGLITNLFNKQDSLCPVFDPTLFTSTMRHDLRTPINALIGYSEMLVEDFCTEGILDFCQDLQKIVTSSRHLLIVISELSHFAQRNDPAKLLESPALSQGDLSIDAVLHTMRSAVQQPVEFVMGEARLLVVDDKESNRDLLSRRLDRQGFHVDIAVNGLQALQKVQEFRYDLVLLDIIMPEMNGFQVLGAIKSDPALRHLPVIMISALDEIDSVVHCIEMGAEDYLQKPFNQVILNAKISATLERKRLRDMEQAYVEQIQREQEKSEKLLLNILPKPIADLLKRGVQTIADSFPDVTILFSDLVKFTELSAKISPVELVENLNEIFLLFDTLAEQHGLEKIKTIGDAYMLVGGLPTPRADHVEAVANMALEMVEAIQALNYRNHSCFQLRIGIHTGPVVAGVIGKNKFNYDLWGDSVNIASRMESQGLPGKVQVSQDTYQRIKHQFMFEERGFIDVKGKGKMLTYLLQKKRL
ncbi:adenylate/guanylate cyclase domain-containing protein [Beggiatoa leptomitoformis]|uniref:Adenylate cyclase n=1 Tax=Beggiatoa leptomitoformis TaxID=288004 RepID=A0A650GDU8_9GAMM|nr:adenylate/guanylate cyclase domain-containing protein [Beggiatoa leptomitoformis]QGX03634.1 response regulator [Beggiatoa leptomitoformis]QGX04072.1 response regulator [Beggiatoa leptomitoformis]